MNKIFFIILTVFGLSQSDYMIPDAGAPGMTVYVEFIGVQDQPEYFMSNSNVGDGFFLNNSGDLNTIKPANGYENLIDIGPFVVSWDGRLISTQVFIDPDANPNTFDYSLLDNQYIVPIEITIDGKPTRTFDFYVVQPFPFGDKSAEIGLIGEGDLGIRSPKNTLVVDEMILGNGTYGFSTQDPDQTLNGNQSYLPLTILSKGDIVGNNSIIDISAQGKNAGPGGGGGAGAVCDIVANGSDGGNGFTGGGPGARNSTNSYRDGGIGSGNSFTNDVNTTLRTSVGPRDYNIGGASINGVFGGAIDKISAQSSGGGTGHPFGLSAIGNSAGNAEVYEGQFGAGSGNKDNGPGGNASHHSMGDGDADYIYNGEPGANAGKIYGNIFGVPLAGGSGGGSGNPNNSNFPFTACSGDGGGGGGALRIFAPSISNVSFLSIGGDGTDGFSDADGGNGSGGFVEINAKRSYNNLSVNTDGGVNSTGNGGSGRLRINSTQDPSNITNSDNESGRFEGFSTDSISYVQSSDILEIRKNSNFDLNYYVKPKGGNWNLYQQFTGNATDLTMPLNNLDQNISKTWYGLAVGDHDGFQQDQYEEIPEYILSQAGANIFIFSDSPEPEIECEEVIDLSLSNCNEDVYEYQLIIENIGNSDLEIDLTAANISENWLSILNPNTETITSNSSIVISLIIDKTSLVQGSYSATLSFPTNDSDEDPKSIIVNLNIEGSNFFYEDSSNNLINDYKKEICFSDVNSFSDVLDLENNNSSTFVIRNIRFANNNLVLTDLDANFLINPGQTFQIGFELSTLITNNPQRNEYLDTLIFEYENCVKRLPISLAIDDDFLIPVDETQFDFGNVTINTTDNRGIVLKYIGYVDRVLNRINGINAPFSLQSQNPLNTQTLTYGDFVTLNLEFTPTNLVQYDIPINFDLTDLNCDQENYQIIGEGSEDRLVYETFIDLGDVESCQLIDTVLSISNNGAEIQLGNTISFISNELNIDIAGASRIPENSTLDYTIEFNANSATIGEYNGFWSIDVLNVPGIDEIRVNFRANVYEMNFAIDDYDFGDFPWGIDSDVLSSELTFTGNLGAATITNIVGSDIRFIESSNELDNANLTSSLSFTLFSPNELIRSLTNSQIELVSENSCTYLVPFNYFISYSDQDINLQLESTFEEIDDCEEERRFFIEVEKLGPGEVSITNINFIGDNDALFTPVTLTPVILNSDQLIELLLDTEGLNFDEYSSTISIEYVANNIVQVKELELIYRKWEGLSVEDNTGRIDPVGKNFGVILVGNYDSFSATITNDSSWNFEWEDPDNSNLIPEFILDPPYVNNNDAVFLPFSVTFSPTSENIFRDTLRFPVINISRNCRDTLLVPLSGNGGNALDVIVNTGDVLADEDFNEVEIPVYIYSFGNSNTFSGLNIDSLTIVMNRTVFHPLNLSSGSFNSIDYLENELVMNIKIEDLELLPNSNNLITNIEGLPLLGDTKVSEIISSSLILNNSSLLNSASFSSGSFTLTVCEDGADRLLIRSNPLGVNINLVIDELQLEISALEVGTHRIEIIDLNGNLIYEETIQNQQVGSILNSNINTSGISSGVYYVRVIAPNDFVIKSIIINN